MSWEKVKLGDVCEVIAGQSPPSATYNNQKIGLPFYQGKADFGNDYPKVRMWCSDPNKIAKPMDILLSVRAPVGPTNICDVQSCIGRGLAAIRSNGKTDPKFVYYYFKFIEPVLSKKGSGSTFSAITIGNVKDLDFPKVALFTQKKIVAILEQADELRKKDQQLLAQYDALQQSVFFDMFGDPALNNNSAETKKYLLGEIADIVSGVAKNENSIKEDFVEVPYMRVANVQDSHIVLKEVKKIKVSVRDFNKFLLKPNDILLTEGGDPDKLGRGAVWHNEIEPCIHQNHIFRVRVDPKIVNPVFLSFQIGSKYGKSYFLKAAKQTTGIASINLTQLKNFVALIPSAAMQNKFANIAKNIEQQKEQIKEQVQQSESLFQTLLQKAFSGELIKE